ncbi:hypothetical protein COX26_00140 [Candidatus Jorgensenbacteria bacterium CG23_combo_of_CG06-09_8_20_14_all_54_14]|uniref:Type II toxin-antitoxin system HicA family toxin n=1 Tax=Candidatus Jorgensenbacteria bacterium CG23_combo_of_CG06-09_8_20_14_all_54_14 TaxID=1974595 RepID=A0A2G9ZAP6_9BACT|nr:MAG: hypothetical protein COX26_00140 [Candidatus Jorgensenbacteria bacterium CG23_combo_of_CG06-09_8_20_14_all_54_14]
MPKIKPLHWKVIARAFERDGWRLDRIAGDHVVYVKAGYPRPVVFPKEKEIDVFIIKNNLKTARMTRERFFELLGKR